MNKLILAIALSLPTVVSAESLALYGGGYSRHIVGNGVTNESHDLIGIQYGSYVAGRFNNSFGRESYFVAYENNWRPFESMPNIQTFTWTGVVRGYENCVFDSMLGNSKICAYLVGGIRYTRWFIEPAFAQVGDATSLIVAARF